MGGRHKDTTATIRMWSWKYLAFGLVAVVAIVWIVFAILH